MKKRKWSENEPVKKKARASIVPDITSTMGANTASPYELPQSRLERERGPVEAEVAVMPRLILHGPSVSNGDDVLDPALF